MSNSENNVAHDHHDAHHGGPDHVPHVLPIWVYLATWGALMVLTVITVAVSYLDLGAFNLVIALLIATIKATIVALMFMHLKYDHKFHAIIFSFSIIFLGIFVAFTMFDTETRGQADPHQADRSLNVKAPFSQTVIQGKQEAKLKEKYGLPPDQPLPPAAIAPPQDPPPPGLAAPTPAPPPAPAAPAAPAPPATPEATQQPAPTPPQ